MERIKKLNNDINNLENKINQEESFAMSLLKTQKNTIKKLFATIYILIFVIVCLIGYLIYDKTHYVIEETTEYAQEVQDIDDSNINQTIGD